MEDNNYSDKEPQTEQKQEPPPPPPQAKSSGGGGWGGWGFSPFSVLTDLQKAAEEISRNVRFIIYGSPFFFGSIQIRVWIYFGRWFSCRSSSWIRLIFANR